MLCKNFNDNKLMDKTYRMNKNKETQRNKYFVYDILDIQNILNTYVNILIL